jgi:citrate synthase
MKLWLVLPAFLWIELASEREEKKMPEISYSRGLAGVIADESSICVIDGEKGELYYHGYPIQVLAQESSFCEVSYLLLHEKLPNAQELAEFEDKLRCYREIPDELRDLISRFPRDIHPMRGLQASVALLGAFYPLGGEASMEEERELATRLVACFPTIIGSLAMRRQGRELTPSRSDLSHAGNFLYLLQGKEPDPQIEKMFDVCLSLHAEHTFNASTFTGRVVGSTLADLHSSVAAAVGALFGPLHGGANERVLDMVEEIGSVDNVASWFATAMEKKRKIMGMGHRVYKTIDPRATILKTMLTELADSRQESRNLDILNDLAERMAQKMSETHKPVWPNVDYFSGTLYTMMGIEPVYYTPIFALARISGWVAHILELWKDNRLYRPRCHYVGEKDLRYTPLDQR